MAIKFTNCMALYFLDLYKNLKIEFVGGKRMRPWMNEAIDLMKKLAIDAKLDAIEADGRKGFDKYVDASPFRPVYTHYEMELR